jgi:hypothetical protein
MSEIEPHEFREAYEAIRHHVIDLVNAWRNHDQEAVAIHVDALRETLGITDSDLAKVIEWDREHPEV